MYHKTLYIFCLLCLSAVNIKAQDITFFRTYGSGAYDAAESVWPCNDSGFVVVGATSGYNVAGTDLLIFRTDKLGNQTWLKTYGGNGNEWAKCIIPVPNSSDFIIVGHTNSFGFGQYDFYVLRINQTGDTIWTRTFGGPDWDLALSADTTYDGNIVITGETSSFGAGNKDVFVIKISPNGSLIWQQTIGGADDDIANVIFEDRDTNLIVAGSTLSYGAGQRDYYLIKLNKSGDTLFTKTFGTALDEWFSSGDMYFDNGNNMSYCIGGNFYDAGEDIVVESLSRITANGIFNYATQGNPSNQYERRKTIVRNEAAWGTFYLVNTYKDNPFASFDINLRRTNYGFGTYSYSSIIGSLSDEFTNDIRKTYDNGYVMVGRIDNYGPGSSACFIAKTDSNGLAAITPTVGSNEISSPKLRIYPNPATNMIYVDLHNEAHQILSAEITNMQGQTIKHAVPSFISGPTLSISLQNLMPGAYILKLITPIQIYAYRIIVAE